MFEEDNTLPLREKMVDGITSADLWTIFTSCPIEKGSPEVYSEYCRAKEKDHFPGCAFFLFAHCRCPEPQSAFLAFPQKGGGHRCVQRSKRPDGEGGFQSL